MKTQWAWAFVVTLLTCMASEANLFGQSPYPSYPGMNPGAAYGNPGQYGAMRAAYGGEEGMPMPEPDSAYGYEGEYLNDGSGYGRQPGRTLLDLILPNCEGGLCAPRWYDFYVDAIQLRRESTARRNLDFTHDGVGAGGTSVLSTDNLDFGYEYGFRAAMAFQFGPGGNIELGYMGTFNFNTAATVNGTDNLYSVMSQFGVNPPGGFDQTDAAMYHNIQYSSAFNTFEIMYRRRQQAEDCRIQTSWLAGVRYFELTEDLIHNTARQNQTETDTMNYLVRTGNALTGFQIGVDGWMTLIPGMRVGADFKTGIYGNHARQNTTIQTTSAGDPLPTILEGVKGDDAALISEANLMMIYKISHSWTFRAGYSFLYLNGVALATENFNPNAPNFGNVQGFDSIRQPFLNSNGNILYHGATLGLEYMW